MRLEGPNLAAYAVDDAAASRRDRWSESSVGGGPHQVRSSPIERAAVGEVPSEATSKVVQRDRQKQERRQRTPGVKTDVRELSTEEQAEVAELAEIDRRVRAHELAHLVSAGGMARGGASFTYRTGPDGKQYAVAGEVQIDFSASSDNPDEAIAKAEAAEAAALAPADPSPQDRAVAAKARQAATEARRQKFDESAAEGEGGTGEGAVAAEDAPVEEVRKVVIPDVRIRAYTAAETSVPGFLFSTTA